MVQSHRSSLTVAGAGAKAHSLNPDERDELLQLLQLLSLLGMLLGMLRVLSLLRMLRMIEVLRVLRMFKDDETAASDKIDARSIFRKSIPAQDLGEIKNENRDGLPTTAHKSHDTMKNSSTLFSYVRIIYSFYLSTQAL